MGERSAAYMEGRKIKVINGLVLGRFQPLHLGHVEFLGAAKQACSRLYVGVTNPDPDSLVYTEQDPRRSLIENNPFSYFDRARMIEETAISLGWAPADFMIIPAPIESISKLRGYLPPPKACKFLATVYDAWGDEKISRMESLGYSTHVLWRRTYSERFTTGTDVRQLMRLGGEWHHLVPSPVASYVREQGLVS